VAHAAVHEKEDHRLRLGLGMGAAGSKRIAAASGFKERRGSKRTEAHAGAGQELTARKVAASA